MNCAIFEVCLCVALFEVCVCVALCGMKLLGVVHSVRVAPTAWVRVRNLLLVRVRVQADQRLWTFFATRVRTLVLSLSPAFPLNTICLFLCTFST